MSVLHDVTKALIFYVSREKRLWIDRKPADDDPLVLRVKEYEKLIDAAEREMALGPKKSVRKVEHPGINIKIDED